MTTAETSAFARNWTAWHAERERELREPYGVLSLTALHWLAAKPSSHPGIPGKWRTDGEAAYVRVGGGDTECLTLNGAQLSGTERIVVPETGACLLSTGEGIEVEVIRRGGHYGLRVRDPESPTLRGFQGIPTYDPDPFWVVAGVFVAHPFQQVVGVDSAVLGIGQTRVSHGLVRFVVADHEQTLVTFGDPARGLQLLFADATSGDTTALWRVLTLGTPDLTGRVVLDFNRAANLPFAFNAFGTCPRPPETNTLDIAVYAGEKAPPR